MQASPGNQSELVKLLEYYSEEEKKTDKIISPKVRLPRMKNSSMLAGTLILAIVLGLSLLANIRVPASVDNLGKIRMVLVHPGVLIAESAELPPEIEAKLREGVSPELVLGAERYPVSIEIQIDGKTVLENRYSPGGMRNEGRIVAVEIMDVSPGSHEINILLQDDKSSPRTVFSKQIEIESGFVNSIVFEPDLDRFFHSDK